MADVAQKRDRVLHAQFSRAFTVIVIGATSALLVGCNDDGGETESSGGEQEVHWSYEGDSGPDHWGELSDDFALCASGQEQSPVDIPSQAPVNSSGLTIKYQPSALNILNNGHTIQANYDSGSAIEVEGQTYELLQFHFHIPSEHRFDGSQSDMELHFVHKTYEGATAVIGVPLESGEPNAVLADIWANLPEEEAEEQTIEGVTINADEMLPSSRDYVKLDGSLTTPPCTEGVSWLVMQRAVEVSEDQIDAFEEIFPLNARPVQPLNEREFQEGH